MSDILVMTMDVVTWADKVSPNRQPKDAVVKLVSEVSELLDAVLNKSPEEVEGELADCQILLLDLAKMYGVNLRDATHNKMAINRARKWAEKDGVIRRVKEEG